MTCSDWPSSPNYGCTKAYDWTPLDFTMNITDTAECEFLCRQQGQNGCCHLGQYGCHWVHEAVALFVVNDTSSIAVNCITGEIMVLNFTSSGISTGNRTIILRYIQRPSTLQ